MPLISLIFFPFLWLLSLLYALLFFGDRWRKKKTALSLKKMILISVGNISAGGSGKTPFAIYLSSLLLKHYPRRTGILMRGYRSALEKRSMLLDLRKHKSDPAMHTGFVDGRKTPDLSAMEITLISGYECGEDQVKSYQNSGDLHPFSGKKSSTKLSLQEFLQRRDLFPGDEALLYPLNRIPVILGIGQKRWCNALAMEEMDIRISILDDGLQHHKIKRDLNLVIVDSLNPDAGGLIPLGKRREPLSLMKNLPCIILSKWNLADSKQKKTAETFVKKYAPKAEIFHAEHLLGDPYPLWYSTHNDTWLNIFPRILQAGERVALFCALGQPESFFRSATSYIEKTMSEKQKESQDKSIESPSENSDFIQNIRFPDHYRYSAEDLEKLCQRYKLLLCTEKDAVKVQTLTLSRDCQKKIWTIPLTWKFSANDEERFHRYLFQEIQKIEKYKKAD